MPAIQRLGNIECVCVWGGATDRQGPPPLSLQTALRAAPVTTVNKELGM